MDPCTLNLVLFGLVPESLMSPGHFSLSDPVPYLGLSPWQICRAKSRSMDILGFWVGTNVPSEEV